MKRLLLTLALVACSSEKSQPPAPAPAPAAAPSAPARPAVAQPDLPAVTPVDQRSPSIYDLDMALTDQNGAKIKLDVDRGHVTLVAMFYGSCTVVCPLIIAELKQTLAELPAAVRKDARVLMVSFDPVRDTPEHLEALATERQLDEHFTLARPTDADARTLAAVLGVKYRKLDDGQFAHGATIIALDRDGSPIARVDQLGQRSTLTRAVIAETAIPSS